MIDNIHIRNLRSIISADVSLSNITVFVGPNDSGKSNVLRALNLFFNGELERGRRLKFDADYPSNAKQVAGKAKEIVVELTITPPSTYKERRRVVWRKAWRWNSLEPHAHKRFFEDGSEISARSKIGVWLDRLQFEYVPAIKSNDYFIALLRELHDTFAQTIDADLRDASAGFVATIHKHTKSMSTKLQSALGFSSDVELPANLGSLFEVLEFNTRENGISVPLSSRGDGVKVRHIPIILKFIADQRNINASSGSIRADTIWGYEEPENNLELAKAYELRDEFLGYGADTQIIMTTHSPAFYGICEVASTVARLRYYVTRSVDGTKIEPNPTGTGAGDLDRELGLLPLVEPHIRAAVEEARELRATIAANRQHLPEPNVTSVFVEGITDRPVVQALLAGKLDSGLIKTAQNGGANWVADCLLATVALGASVGHSIGVFDGDNAGEEASKRVDELSNIIRKSPTNISKVRVSKIKPDDEVLELRKKGLMIPVALEELAGTSAWAHAESKGWLEPRTDLFNYNSWTNPDVAFFDHCASLGISPGAIRRLKFRVGDNYKQKFSTYLLGQIESGKLSDHPALGALKMVLVDAVAQSK